MSKRANAPCRVGSVFITVLCASLLALLGCGDKAAEEAAKAPLPPALGVLELPVSLRSSDAAPADARKLDVSMTELRVDDQVVLPLANGQVAAAERGSDGVLPKLEAALASPARAALSLSVHASLPYETAALILNTAAASGMRKLAFQVRKPGASTDAGWLAVDVSRTTPRTDDEIAFSSVQPRKWDEFTTEWQAVYDACRGSQTGSCAYVPGSMAKGGSLKIVLFAAGQGVNVNFFRTGLTPAELAAEEQQRKAELANKKEDFVQGRGVSKTDLEAELLEGDPANEALFQFRAKDALDSPSAVTNVMKPLCGTKACGAVVSAESNTLMVRVVSLIGAAYADGAAPPVLAFELPWTEKPKPAPEAAAAAAPAAK